MLPIRRRWALHYLRRVAPRKPFVGRFRGGYLEVRPGEIASEVAYYHGFFERELTSWCLQLVRSQTARVDLLVDVGANFGYYPILLGLESLDTVRSIAFEPDTANFNWLRRNISLNKLTNITCEQLCLGAVDGETVTLRQFGEGFTGGVRVVSGMPEHRAGTVDHVVGSCRLDTYLDRISVDRVPLVVIDVEGYEGKVIAGMADGLSRGRYERVAVEVHPWAFPSIDAIAQEVFDPFLSRGYVCHRVQHCDNPRMDDERATYVLDIPEAKLFGPLSLDGMGGWQHFVFRLPGMVGTA